MSNLPTLDGSTSRALILLAVIASATVLAWHNTISGEAYVGLLGIVLGGVVHASGSKQGTDAALTTPPK